MGIKLEKFQKFSGDVQRKIARTTITDLHNNGEANAEVVNAAVTTTPTTATGTLLLSHKSTHNPQIYQRRTTIKTQEATKETQEATKETHESTLTQIHRRSHNGDDVRQRQRLQCLR